MTPFLKDVVTVLFDYTYQFKCGICYYFGHNFSKYEYHLPTDRSYRFCKRCNSQESKIIEIEKLT